MAWQRLMGVKMEKRGWVQEKFEKQKGHDLVNCTIWESQKDEVQVSGLGK